MGAATTGSPQHPAPPAPPGTPLGKVRPHHANAGGVMSPHVGYENKVCSTCQPPLLYQGGPVVGTASTPGEVTVYPVYWAPDGTSFDPAYQAIIDGYIKNVAAASGTNTNVLSVGTEYYQTVSGQNQNIQYLVHAGQELDATDAPSASDPTCQPTDGTSTVCVTDAQMQDEILNLINAKGLPADLGHIYSVFLPNGVQTQGSDGTFSGVDFCGYHSNFGITGGSVLYFNMPYGAICDSGQSPNGNPAADDAIDSLDHELLETITDPLGNGWGDAKGNEIGDECNSIYGAPLGSTSATNPAGGGTSYNQAIGTGQYYSQEEYSNAAGACVQAEGASAAKLDQVTVTLSPASVPADGKSTSTVVATVTDASGNPVANDAVTFNTSAVKAVLGSCGGISPAQVMTTAQGTASATYTATTANVVCNVQASEGASGAAGKTQLTQGSPPPTPTFSRVAGPDRVATAVAASQSAYQAGAAKAVVIASDATFPDALAGGPLAAKLAGPLLLTDPSSLSAATETEIKRVLPDGGPVTIVGGAGAVSQAVSDQLTSDGFSVTRVAGADRFATAVAVADAMGDPSTVVEASGLAFPDALAGGPVAAKLGGVVLLTNGSAQAPETADYLAAHPGTRVALGGPAAHADPSAQSIVGSDRYDTAAKVAAAYFPSTQTIGLASGLAFPDALAGGAVLATVPAPVLLTDPAKLSAAPSSYLNSVSNTLTTIAVFGGTAAVSDTVANQAVNAG